MSQGGRPTEYRQEYPELLMQHFSEGLTYESFAGRVGVCRATLYNWEKIPEFLDAKKRGVEMALYHWDQFGVDTLKSGNKCDTAMYIHRMGNQFKWRRSDDNNPVVEVEKKDDKLILNFPDGKKLED